MIRKRVKDLVRGECYVLTIPFIPRSIMTEGDRHWRSNEVINVEPGPLGLFGGFFGSVAAHREVKINGHTEPFAVQAAGDLSEFECRTLGDYPVGFKLPRDGSRSVLVLSQDEVSNVLRYS